jgi:YbbR domain-containing protein
MTRFEPSKRSWPVAALDAAKSSVLNVYDHWALALFSLAAAFSIWFVIQDVENPRVTARYPDAGFTIPVDAENVDQLIPDSENNFVAVTVEGREDDLAALSVRDFEARIDIKGVPPGVPTALPVKVRSLRGGVDVLSVEPPTITVTLEPLATKTFEVQDNQQGQLPAGLIIKDSKIEPLTVEVRGLQKLLDSVVSVDVDVNLAGLREGSNEVNNEVKARSIAGRDVDVTITPSRAKVTYQVQQSFVQKSLPVIAPTTGQVAAGYRIVSESVDPPTVSASGPADLMSGLSELLTQPIDVSNANSEVRLIRSIDVQQNISVERRTVTVRIDIRPIDCATGTTTAACGALSVQVAPIPTDQPPNLVVLGSLRVTVQLTGPLSVLDTITPSMITAKVSLAGGQAGTGSFPVTVTLPATLANAGVRAEISPPITVQLGPP